MITPDALRGHQLVKVARLAWSDVAWSDFALSNKVRPCDLSVGPVQLVFEDGRGIVVSGRSDWSLDLVETQANDEDWLAVYDYDDNGASWVLRDASSEQPFATVLGRTLGDWELIRNEIGEAVGMTMDFDGSSLVLKTWGGEIKT